MLTVINLAMIVAFLGTSLALFAFLSFSLASRAIAAWLYSCAPRLGLAKNCSGIGLRLSASLATHGSLHACAPRR
jgi:hypothetical protein